MRKRRSTDEMAVWPLGMSSGEQPFNDDTLNGIPTAPPKDLRLEISLVLSDRNHTSHVTIDPGTTDEGLLPQSCLDLADIG